MPSNLRLQSTFDSQSTQSYFPKTSPSTTPAKKQRMSLTQTYRVASTARSKLGQEAARADHDLRLLVGHANLLDSLMVELANAEREQESWFNQSLRTSSKPEAPRHVQWIDTIAEEEDDEESDSDSDYDEEDQLPQFPVAPRRASSPPPTPYTLSAIEVDEDDEEAVEDFDYDAEHALVRTESHLPELMDEDSVESDDDSMPPSPPQTPLEFEEEQRQAMQTNSFFQKASQRKASHPEVITDDIFMAAANAPQMVSAY